MGIILAIDDDKHILNILRQQIEKLGHDIILAESGKEGLEYALAGNPDVILLDIIMPELSGHDVIKKLRREELTKLTPVIMLTSSSKKADVTEAMRYGAVDYIIKPHNAQILTKKIEAAIKYGTALKEKKAIERTSNIIISRDSGNTLISFLTDFKKVGFIDDVKRSFSTSFLSLVKNDSIIFDLRGVPDFGDKDIAILLKLTNVFSSNVVYIVAGKHYGKIATAADLENKFQLFISLGDFEIFQSEQE